MKGLQIITSKITEKKLYHLIKVLRAENKK